MEEALRIVREFANREADKRQALLPPDLNYDHLRSNEPPGASMYGYTASVLFECARAIEKAMVD